MIENKHLTVEGLQELVGIKASLNNGLSDKLKEAFPQNEQRFGTRSKKIKR